MRAIILSAGLGERLRPLTLQRAKPAIEFLNMPMLAFPYYWLDTVDLHHVVFNTHYLPDTIRHAAMHVVSPSTQMHFSHEEEILGSGGGIWNARFHLQPDKNFAVANGDAVVAFEHADAIEQMLRFHESHDAFATILVCPLEGVGKTIPGVWLDKYGEVANFGKNPSKDYLECLHYASFMFVSNRVWEYMPEGSSNILYDVFTAAISRGEKVYGYRVDNMHWFETGNVSDYLNATRICLEYLRNGSLYGAGLRAMLDRFLRFYRLLDLRLFADSCEVADRVDMRGYCVLGERAQIGSGARLENAVVLNDAKVGASQSVTNDVIIDC